jgi:hypothetical protein
MQALRTDDPVRKVLANGNSELRHIPQRRTRETASLAGDACPDDQAVGFRVETDGGGQPRRLASRCFRSRLHPFVRQDDWHFQQRAARTSRPDPVRATACRRAALVVSSRPSRKPGLEKAMSAEIPVEDEGQSPRHGIGLAVFVIIVLLIATITLSLFLRQQPQSGEGLSLDDGVASSFATASPHLIASDASSREAIDRHARHCASPRGLRGGGSRGHVAWERDRTGVRSCARGAQELPSIFRWAGHGGVRAKRDCASGQARNLMVLESFEARDDRAGLATDLAKTAHAAYAIELCDRLCPPRQAGEAGFRMARRVSRPAEFRDMRRPSACAFSSLGSCVGSASAHRSIAAWSAIAATWEEKTFAGTRTEAAWFVAIAPGAATS